MKTIFDQVRDRRGLAEHHAVVLEGTRVRREGEEEEPGGRNLRFEFSLRILRFFYILLLVSGEEFGDFGGFSDCLSFRC